MKILKNNQGANKIMIIGIVAFVAGLLILAFVFYTLYQQKKNNLPLNKELSNEETANNNDEILDIHGCSSEDGFSWCELNGKCILTSEEKCATPDPETLVKEYITNNITQISPQKAVLGGKFMVTDFRFIDDKTVEIDFEDGHIAVSASIVYVIENGKVYIQSYKTIDNNKLNQDIGSSTSSRVEETIDDMIEEDKALEEVRELLAFEFGVEQDDVIVQFTIDRGEYARGEMIVSSNGNESKGKFFVKKINGKYELAETGIVDLDCASLEVFPMDMVPECNEEY